MTQFACDGWGKRPRGPSQQSSPVSRWFICLRIAVKALHSSLMKLFLAVLVFSLFAIAIGGGILMLMAGKPLLFILAMLAFLGTFAKYGCASQ